MARNMGAGRFRKRLEIKKDGGATYDSRGQAVQSTVKVAEVWAQVEPLTGREAILARQLDSTLSHRVRLRYDEHTKDINTKHWLEFDGRTLNISDVRNLDERDKEFELICGERV